MWRDYSTQKESANLDKKERWCCEIIVLTCIYLVWLYKVSSLVHTKKGVVMSMLNLINFVALSKRKIDFGFDSTVPRMYFQSFEGLVYYLSKYDRNTVECIFLDICLLGDRTPQEAEAEIINHSLKSEVIFLASNREVARSLHFGAKFRIAKT
jgi:hypothetical protein